MASSDLRGSETSQKGALIFQAQSGEQFIVKSIGRKQDPERFRSKTLVTLVLMELDDFTEDWRVSIGEGQAAGQRQGGRGDSSWCDWMKKTR